MNANRKMSKAEMLRQPKKETKGGKRKQKLFLRKAIARKLKVPASSLKGKTFEELSAMLNNENLSARKLLKEIIRDQEELDVEDVMEEMLDIVEQSEEPPISVDFEEEEKVMESRQAKKIAKEIEEGSDLPSDIANLISGLSVEPESAKLEFGEREGRRLLRPRPEEQINKTISEHRRRGIFQEGKYDHSDDEDDLDQAEIWQYPALGIAPNANLEVPNSSLNDNMIRSVNARSAFQPDPLVPVRQRYEPARREVLEDNENMRNDPNPSIIPQQDILEQVRILEGPEGQMPHGEPHRLPNPVIVNDPRLAQDNMGSMQQNVMMNRNMMDRRELRRNMFGEGEEGKFDDPFGAMPENDDFRELDQNEDIYEEEFEGMSNRERIDEMKKIMSYQQAGRWNGNMGVGRDYARSALVLGNEATIDTTDRMRKEELYPYKIPNRTYAGNAVNLVRNSNRSMLLQTGELLP